MLSLLMVDGGKRIAFEVPPITGAERAIPERELRVE